MVDDKRHMEEGLTFCLTYFTDTRERPDQICDEIVTAPTKDKTFLEYPECYSETIAS